MDREQDQAVTELGEAIRRCFESLGTRCTARLIGLVAIDLLGDGHEISTTFREPTGRRHRPSRRPPR